MEQIQSIKRKSVTEQAVEILNDIIISRNLQPGDFLPSEAELCRQIGIGRSTLREAVKILESHGIVKKKHGAGVYVASEEHKAITDIFRMMLRSGNTSMEQLMEVRVVNEIKTAELAAKYATAEDIAEIERYLQIMRDIDTSTADYIAADIDFHVAIAKASGNRIFHLIMQTIRPLIAEMVGETLKADHRPERSMKYHEKIYQAIVEKDPAGAVKAISEHLTGAREMLK